MIPVIAIVGRPNVGKSTLFNCLTKSRAALVADMPGVTRDRLYGEGKYQNNKFIVVDTGGIDSDQPTEMTSLMTKQAMHAIEEANAILFVVDARDGLTFIDEKIANHLRTLNKPIFIVVNKTDGLDVEVAKAEFFKFGFGEIVGISAAHNRGINHLIEQALAVFSQQPSEELPANPGIKIAVIGKPNVGKSTLVNRILGEERVVVFDEPGTTRDSIFIPFTRSETAYTLIDTAGVRRRSRVEDGIEKFSVIKTLQAIEQADVVVFVIDAREGIAEQDMRLLDFVIEAGRAFIIAINKWDGLSEEQRKIIRQDIERRLEFAAFARVHFISALHGSGVGNLFTSIIEAYDCAMMKLSTPVLTRLLQSAVTQHQPPLVHGRRIKLRYAHSGGHNPQIIVIHGTQTKSLPIDYVRYLSNFFRKKLKLIGTPIRIELRSGENPFANRKNILTPRQERKRKRLLKHIKK